MQAGSELSEGLGTACFEFESNPSSGAQLCRIERIAE
jgi:hypothetical protein